MRATCIHNDPQQLADHQQGRAAEFESPYPLTVGKTYVVLGMTVWENVFEFLVRDDSGGPCFAAAGFFDLLTARVPEGWQFGLRSSVRASGRDLWSSPGVAVWGYPEQVTDPAHAAALQEQEAVALRVFAAYHAAAESSHD